MILNENQYLVLVKTSERDKSERDFCEFAHFITYNVAKGNNASEALWRFMEDNQDVIENNYIGAELYLLGNQGRTIYGPYKVEDKPTPRYIGEN